MFLLEFTFGHIRFYSKAKIYFPFYVFGKIEGSKAVKKGIHKIELNHFVNWQFFKPITQYIVDF